MKYKLITEISFALLMARWKQTLVAAIGVTFSIAMFITLLGFMTGLNQLLDGIMLNSTAHIRLYNELKPSKEQPIDHATQYRVYHNFINSVKPKSERLEIHSSASVLAVLNNDPRVLGTAPKITTQVFYNVGVVDLNGIISGIDVEAESRLFLFNDYMVSGNYMDLQNTPNSIVLGKGIADKMLVQVGDIMQVTTSRGDRMQLKVVGYYQSGVRELDNVQSYCSLQTTRKLLGESSNYVTDIQIKLHDISLAPQLAKEYAALFEVDALDIQTANAQFETGSSVRTLISYAVGITLLIVAGFGIFNILNMMIYEKMDSIAILKATGFSGNDVRMVFITVASSIGIAGAVLGLLLGYGLSAIIDKIPFETASLPTVDTYPVDYDPLFYVIGAVFAVVTTYLAGYFPSRKASKIDPVLIIRGK